VTERSFCAFSATPRDLRAPVTKKRRFAMCAWVGLGRYCRHSTKGEAGVSSYAPSSLPSHTSFALQTILCYKAALSTWSHCCRLHLHLILLCSIAEHPLLAAVSTLHNRLDHGSQHWPSGLRRRCVCWEQWHTGLWLLFISNTVDFGILGSELICTVTTWIPRVKLLDAICAGLLGADHIRIRIVSNYSKHNVDYPHDLHTTKLLE